MAIDNEILAGRLTADTSEFTKKISDAVKAVNEQLAHIGDGSKQANKEIKDLASQYAKLVAAKEKAKTAAQNSAEVAQARAQAKEVRNITTEYSILKNAITEYNRAKKAGDNDAKAYWKGQIDQSDRLLQAYRNQISQLGLTEQQQRKVTNTIKQGEDAVRRFNAAQREGSTFSEGLANQWTKIANVLKIVSGFSLYKIFGDAMNYAKEFDAALTDISIITTSTRGEVESLGTTYRKMANDLRVSSTDIAKANATIFRQGFTDPNEAQAITRGATKFGAVTGIGTSAAIQNMTAAIQNFYEKGTDVEAFVNHLGDVWSYMGDTVATTGEQISEAMAKSSASVKAVGVSMEEASSWAAIMLAKTQQAGNVIGTQMNSLIARYSKVTSKGYAAVTADDEGEALSFNDVSKALRTVGIELYDTATKSFLPMNQMMDQLADKWNTLDEAQQKYIATTLGGTRGMNYLLTLLQNYNDAVDLQKGVIDGVVNTKYEAWMQGVEAAQNNLTNSMQNLYAYMSNDLLTGFYNGMANVVDIFTAATDAAGGLNLVLPLVAAGILAIWSAVLKFKEVGGIIGLISKGNIGMIVAAIGAIATIIGGIVSAVKNANSVDIGKLRDDLAINENEIAKWKSLATELDEFSGKTEFTAEEMERFATIRAQIVADSPSLQYAYGAEGEKLKGYGEAAAVVASQLELLYRRNAALRSQMYGENKKNYLAEAQKIMGSGRNGDLSSFASLSGVMGKDRNYPNGYNASNSEDADYALRSLSLSLQGNLSRFNPANMTLLELRQYRDQLLEARGSEEYKNALDSTREFFDGLYDDIMREIDDAMIIKEGDLSDLKKTFISDFMGIFSARDQEKMHQSGGETFMQELISSAFDTEHATSPEGLLKIENDARRAWVLYSDAIQNGLTKENRRGLLGIAGHLGLPGDNPITVLLDNWGKAMEFAGSLPEGTRAQLEQAVQSWSPEILNAFVEALSKMEGDGELDWAARDWVDDFVNKWLNISEKELKDATSEAGDGGGSTGEPTYADTIRAAINDTKELQQAINALKATDGTPLDAKLIEKLSNTYPQLNEALQAYADAITSEDADAITSASQALSWMMQTISDNAEGLAGLTQIENITAMMDKLASGDYDVSDLESIVNTLGLTMQDLTAMSPEELMDMLSEKLREQTTEWGRLAEAMGIVLDEYKSFSEQVENTVHPMTSAEKALRKITETTDINRKAEQLSVKEVEELIGLYPDLADELTAYGKNTKNTTKLIDELNKHVADDAMAEWVDSVESAVKKLDNAKTGTKDYTKAMVELSNAFDFQGMGQLENMDFVTQNLDNIRAAANGSAEAFRALQEAAWVNIIGTSSVDFSNIENGIAMVGEDAQRLAQVLVALGYFEVETKQLNSTQEVISGVVRDVDGLVTGVTTEMMQLNGTYQVLKPSSANPFASRGVGGGSSGGSGGGGGGKKGGGGGGGGGGSMKVSDATKNYIDNMSKAQEEYDNRLKLIQLKKEYHDIRGELQGVIQYSKLEQETLEDQNKTLESNITSLEQEIAKKQAIIDKNKKSSNAYKQAALDLEELNKTHKEYSEKLLENINDIEKLTKELAELQETARQTVIAVQELIRETLEGQRDYERGILDGTVTLEDEIVEIIKTRYEKEQEAAIEAAEAKKQALQEEIDKIDELIEARKKLLDTEEKSKEIAELQAKISRIAADPTRRKEMMELQARLADLQKEQAWESYEEQLKAQKESINEQMNNIDDYMDYVNEYYEDLFEHPKKLIAEMREIIKRSDSEIIEWLKTNSEEWEDYTDARRQQAEEDWQEMVNNMRGVTETYQKQIEEIMSWTDEEIMEWLKKNNVEFQTTTKEQQESFLYGWKNTLNDWRNAYREVTANVSSMSYSAPAVSSSSGGGSSGGGSSGGGSYGGGSYGGGSSTGSAGTSTAKSGAGSTSLFTAMDTGGKTQALTTPKTYKGTAKYYYKTWDNGKGWEQKVVTSTKDVADAIKQAQTQAIAAAKTAATKNWAEGYRDRAKHNNKPTYMEYSKAIASINKLDSKYIWGTAYKRGGIIDYTGPAWVDGSPQIPERILTGEQNMLFEQMVQALQMIKMVSVPGIRAGEDTGRSALGGSFNIEQILIQPQSLDEDADYDLIAERVGEAIMDGINRTMAIGGIRI